MAVKVNSSLRRWAEKYCVLIRYQLANVLIISTVQYIPHGNTKTDFLKIGKPLETYQKTVKVHLELCQGMNCEVVVTSLFDLHG